MKKLIALILVVLLATGAWFYFSGGLDRVTESRVEAALVDAGAPPELAACMAPKMVERLSLVQLKKLEGLRADDGETTVPLSPSELIGRIQRVDDREALQVTGMAATSCAIGSLLN
ncbi:hypothetical protein [Qipengyuania sp. DGS5-3]|uniref:hypothetical protein n=1 Tax=Qipengyuania sp. DGS5-3 TaxID=3349632 RepID=UPI0036D3D025